ncbi:MAG: DUF7715 family protein [Acidimicrobiia bacterium]
MKVFVAIEGVGAEGDFTGTVPGELVHLPPVVCDCPDCGCERAMGGFVSRKGTTSFGVRELDLDAATYTRLMWDSLREGGWVTDGSAEDVAWVEEWAREHLELAAALPVEEPLRIHEGQMMVRGVGRAL